MIKFLLYCIFFGILLFLLVCFIKKEKLPFTWVAAVIYLLAFLLLASLFWLLPV